MNRRALFLPHQACTVERIAQEESDYILAIQDSTYLNYTNHLAKTDLGRIASTKNRAQYGLIQHSTLCVTEHNEPLGLLDVQFFHHDERNTQIPSDQRALEDKQTDCWLKGCKVLQKKLQNASKTIVTIADREGDFFEFLNYLLEQKQPFIIRAKYDRYTGEKHRRREGRLFQSLEDTEVKARMQVSLYEASTRNFKEIKLALKSVQNIKLPPVYRGRGSIHKTDKPIQVNAVMAYNDTYRWILLTSLPVDTEEDIQRVVKFYRCRWHIEDFHKVLKTVYQVEKIYLHASRQTLENALMLASLSACRFYWMVYVGRKDQLTPADRLFKKEEWESLYVYFKEPLPSKAPPISDVILRIARLGGYKQRKGDKPPGVKTLWIGFQFFMAISTMYHNMLSRKT